jgi:hypothetical protein
MFGQTSEKRPMELVTAKAVGDGVLIVVHRPAEPGVQGG